jgi:putative transcriptional regulator
MSNSSKLSNHFLIAMPGLEDPNFFHTATFICEHNEEGAMGIIVNRPLDVTLEEVLDQMNIEASASVDTSIPIYMGGPVQPEHGFVLHSPGGLWESSMVISDEIIVTTSQDILAAIAHNEGPKDYLIALGYAGWSENQLEDEIAENTWLSGPSNADILFHTPAEERWNSAAALLGVDLNLISSDVGHA